MQSVDNIEIGGILIVLAKLRHSNHNQRGYYNDATERSCKRTTGFFATLPKPTSQKHYQLARVGIATKPQGFTTQGLTTCLSFCMAVATGLSLLIDWSTNGLTSDTRER